MNATPDTLEVYDPGALVNVFSDRQPPSDLTLFEAQPLDQHPAAVYLAGLNSQRSQRTQRQALEVIAELLTGAPDVLACNWAALRFQHTAAIRAQLAGRYAPATANRLLSALRGVLKAAWKLELMPAEDYYRARDLDPITGETLPAGRALPGGEIAALMVVCEDDTTPAGPRDAALIACMYPGGLRREEVVSLDLSDYDPESGALTVRHGKRNKARVTYLTNGAMRAMSDWLAIRGAEPGALFWPINKGGRPTPRRMTNQAVYNALAKRGELAKVKEFSPHDLRRTFISDLLDAGADIATVARLAGHASVTTTQRYDRRPEAAKQKAAGLLHLPYRGRAV
jgi:integrase/recombinase XerD